MKRNLKKVLWAMLLGVAVYMVAALYSGIGKISASLSHYHVWTFVAACALAPIGVQQE